MLNSLAHSISHATSGAGDSHSVPWGLFVVGGVAVILGIVTIAKPKLQWKMNRWAYKNPAALEPSAKGEVAIRVGGAFTVIVGIVLLVVGITRS